MKRFKKTGKTGVNDMAETEMRTTGRFKITDKPTTFNMSYVNEDKILWGPIEFRIPNGLDALQKAKEYLDKNPECIAIVLTAVTEHIVERIGD